MKVEEMCVAAAGLSNRADEYVKNDDDEYEDEALLWRTIYLNAINEAYTAAANKLGIPTAEELVTPDEDGKIDISALSYPLYRITRVMDSGENVDVPFRQNNRNEIQVNTDDDVFIRYVSIPDRLTLDTEEPEFPDEAVPPELYIFLAAARVYQSENKHKSAEPWLREYYQKLNKLRHVGSGRARRVPVRRWR